MPSPITSSGALDVQGIVSALVKAESVPLTKLQADAKKIDVRISSYGKIQSALATFRDAAASLSRASAWQGVKAISSNSAVEISARAGAAATSIAIEVQQLAAKQTVTSGAWASADTVVGGGTLTIQKGSQPSGANSFSPDGTQAAVNVSIPPNATLAQVRDAINASDSGVRASIVKDGNQVRLFLTGAEEGGNQAFKIEVADDDGISTDTTGLSSLAFDPTAATGSGRNLSLARAATDAQYTLDGVALTSNSNRITGALDGVDLVLKQVTSSPAQLDVSIDPDAMQTGLQKFVDAYNALNTLMAEQTRYDPATKAAGALQGDSSAIGMINQIRSALGGAVSGSTLSRLSDAGISLQRDGSLKLNAAQFKETATNPDNLKNLFSAPGTTEADKGLMVRLRELGDRFLSTDGTVSNATSTWEARKAAIIKRQDALQIRLEQVEKRLMAQYTRLDAMLVSAQASGAQLQSALAGLPRFG
jgi:flagellar hook-associated protein 2